VIGETVGSYRITAQLGADGLGTLWAAEHQQGWKVVLRQLKPEYSEPEVVARYMHVVRNITGTQHWGLQKVYENFYAGGRNTFVAMEALEGEPLSAALKREKRFFPELAARLAWQLAAATGTAHQLRIFHGLLHPDAIWIKPDPQAPGGYRATIGGWGNVLFVPQGAPVWNQPRTTDVYVAPTFLSPEQCREGRADHRSDIYSLGCIFFQMACGRPPYLGQSPFDIATAHIQSPPREAQSFEASLPVEVDQLLHRMLTKDPASRIQSMGEVATELERMVQGKQEVASARTLMPTMALTPAKRRGKGRLVAALFGGLVLVGGGITTYVVGGKQGWWAKKEVTPIAAIALDAGPPPQPDAGPPPLTEADKLVIEGQQALGEERWMDATVAAKQALAFDPAHEGAKKLANAAKTEPTNKKVYDDFLRHVRENNVQKIAKDYGKLPETSLFRVKAQAVYERIRDGWVLAHEEEARALAAQKKCSKLAPIQKKVAAVFPESEPKLAEIAKGCTTK
jgi:eukaryotic-like serine/threonine-protein kinase